jgi:SAM-dependent methyltransferase
MLSQARMLWDGAPAHIQNRLTFHECDIGVLRLDMQFDAVVALFHVMSYQASNEAIRAAIATARAHLRSRGIFLFDCWYGPGVMSDPPSARFKRIEDGARRIFRFAEPKLRVDDNIVDVNYQFVVKDSISGTCEEFAETHRMRYFFWPDMFLHLESQGFLPLGCLEWMKHEPPGEKTWNVAFVARINS